MHSVRLLSAPGSSPLHLRQRSRRPEPRGSALESSPVEPAVQGTLDYDVAEPEPGVYKLRVQVSNTGTYGAIGECEGGTDAAETSRDAALRHSLAAAHVVLRVEGGRFVSLTDSPERYRSLAASCQNVGVWPVLVGPEGSDDCMLASPIILSDHPQIAPESAGDFFDGTEIDEILALRVLTLTDEEKAEARRTDHRAREIVDRAESLAPDDWARLHGAVRDLRTLREETS